jgi:outer membrane protein TolC
MKCHLSTLFLLWFGSLSMLSAQELLTLEDAVAEALQNNYSVQVQRYNQESVENNAYAGGAGLLPSLSASGGGQYNNSSASGTLVQGREAISIDTSGITVSSANAGLQLSYTLALANFRNYKVLQGNADLSQEQTRQTIENVALQVVTGYYNLAKLANRLSIQRDAIRRSTSQLASAQNRQSFGSGNRLSVLNAQVNVQTDSINLVTAQISYENAVRDLNLILGRNIDSQYQVDTTASPAPTLDLTILQQGLAETNASLTVAETNRQLAELSLGTAQARRLPTLALNGNYNYNYTNNPFSITPELSTWGPSVSATVNFNIFNGFQTSRSIQSAEINVASRRAQYQQAEQTALRDLTKTYANYESNRQVLALNQTALEAAQLNFSRTQEAFDLGQASSVELREANLNLLRIQNQINDLRFDIKLSEVQLLQLSGQLVSEEELLLDR